MHQWIKPMIWPLPSWSNSFLEISLKAHRPLLISYAYLNIIKFTIKINYHTQNLFNSYRVDKSRKPCPFPHWLCNLFSFLICKWKQRQHPSMFPLVTVGNYRLGDWKQHLAFSNSSVSQQSQLKVLVDIHWRPQNRIYAFLLPAPGGRNSSDEWPHCIPLCLHLHVDSSSVEIDTHSFIHMYSVSIRFTAQP